MTIRKNTFIVLLAAFIAGMPIAAYAQLKPYEWPPKRERIRSELRQKALKEQQEQDAAEKKKQADKPAAPSKQSPPPAEKGAKEGEPVNPYADKVWDMDDVKKYCAVQVPGGARTYENCISRNERRVGRPKHAFDANIINSYDEKF